MKSLVFLAFVLCCSASVVHSTFVVLPYSFAQQYQGQDVFGQSTFGHVSLDQAQQQTRLADGTVVGFYSYVGADGKPAVTTYEAGRKGFRVTGSNILPEAPDVPAAPELKAPTPVEETAEVQQARDEFQKKFDEATSSDRAKRSVSLPGYVVPIATVTKQKFETQQFEPVDAKTPADTTKLELTTKEHEIAVPAVKYVQPVVSVKPVTYTAVSPSVLPYAHTLPFAPYPGLVGAFPFHPIITTKKE